MNLMFPSIIEYQPYNICNANCTYCPVGSLNRLDKTKGASLDTKIFELLIKQTEGKKIKRISPHLNCEPLLCKDLPDQIRIGAVLRDKKVIIPKSNFIFEKDDLVVFLAKREQLKEVESIFSISSI